MSRPLEGGASRHTIVLDGPARQALDEIERAYHLDSSGAVRAVLLAHAAIIATRAKAPKRKARR